MHISNIHLPPLLFFFKIRILNPRNMINFALKIILKYSAIVLDESLHLYSIKNNYPGHTIPVR